MNVDFMKTDDVQIQDLLNMLKKQKNTNLYRFLEFCLKFYD